MVEQFGLAMMPSCHSASPGFTWLTMSGTPASIRQALELSMTVAPRAAASGASWRDTSVPAEKRAMSTPSKASGIASPTVSVRPSALTVDPAERPEASRRSSPTGKLRSASTWIIVRPTTPVAPTTATVSGRGSRDMAPLRLLELTGTDRVYQRPAGRSPASVHTRSRYAAHSMHARTMGRPFDRPALVPCEARPPCERGGAAWPPCARG